MGGQDAGGVMMDGQGGGSTGFGNAGGFPPLPVPASAPGQMGMNGFSDMMGSLATMEGQQMGGEQQWN